MTEDARQHSLFRTARLHFGWAALAVHPSRFATPSEDQSWDDARDKACDMLARLLHVEAERIVLFHNTTSAAQRAVTCALQKRRTRHPVLLTTDLEYPGIIAMLDEVWPGPMYMLQLEELIWRHTITHIPALIGQAVFYTRPDTVYFSHVARGTGYVVPDTVMDLIRCTTPCALVLVDGAQAVGNISVSQKMLRGADVYLASGHKWLGGKPTLGFAYYTDGLEVSDPSQSYSRPDGSAGTGDTLALTGVVRSLSEFEMTGSLAEASALVATNTERLAADLTQRLSNIRGLELPGTEPHWRHNGIVAIRPNKDQRGALARCFNSSVSQEQPPASTPYAPWCKAEPWTTRSRRPAGPRYYLRPSPSDNSRIALGPAADLNKNTNVAPYVRVCVHSLAHVEEDITRLERQLREAIGGAA